MTDALPQMEETAGGKGLARTAGALAGLKVIDLTRVLGGPYCTMILSDHGAEVIKIEPPQGDEVREWGPPFQGDAASYFIGVNRNKKSIALDLGKPAGREVLLRLLEDADVLVENFKPGSMEKWGLGYEEVLSQRFPKLVHCRVSGFGATGPRGGLPGYDAIIQAMVGLMSINGTPETAPVRMGTPIVDLATGLYSTIGILMALQERAKSGRGQYVDMTLHDCGMALLHPQAANFLLNDKRPKATGNPHPNIAPYSAFRTATCEIFVACGNDPAFRKFCAFLGLEGLPDDARFRTNGDRVTNRDALAAILEQRLAQEDGHDLSDRLLAAGLPAGPVLNVDEALSQPHTAHREMVTELDGFRALGTPIKLSRTPGGTRARPPAFNQHGDEVLQQHGFSAEEIAALKTDGILVEKKR
ncbi:CaiB/BaiF CoA-transferase family protein [Pseudoroseomonas cervicalis]|uniref:CaiB/BaiF CoA transferase family protein n=1 Tax=Teichococcus cervicalis TaxID=204525 RepID=UPI00278854B2|nr:CaiB/BaiF CoA-transferase family protein [Pseudoroseomonas cervicalis]MDQ1079990.1 crotonobetainyl-CoA:carnitine CoA-transferase CaiB-like acyl-CoA transferase [Pseudoroseomonas cervicalis]